MPEQKTKNDVAWEKLFDRHDILKRVDTDGACSILAADINKEREARLMTKFDHLINLPHIFKKNGLSILADSRRSYIIGRFDCYAKLPGFNDEEISDASLPLGLESLSATDLYSEPSALLCAQHAGLMANALEEKVDLTVFGRMSTGQFSFSIATAPQYGAALQPKKLQVTNAQCEIDGGYEGSSLFAIIEAKNQAVEDFHIRQLYYPYRLWTGKIGKPVIPVFFTYSNEIFSFYIYEFADPTDYNSLQLVRRKHYQIVPTEIEVADIRAILQKVKSAPEPESMPFPQADRFERVIDLLGQLHTKGPLTQEDITTNYAFDVRQTQYYTTAGRYLGLIESSRDAEQGVTYALTETGARIMRKEPRARNLALVEVILSRRVFRDAMNFYLTHATPPSTNEIVGFMKKAGLAIDGSTPARRASSVLGWIRWVMNLTSDA